MDRTQADISWSKFSLAIERLELAINSNRATNINSTELRSMAREATQMFFRECAVQLLRLEIEPDLFDRLNEICQHLLKLSSRQNSKKSYVKIIRQLRRVIDEITVDREIKYWDISALESDSDILSDTESLIYDTLNRFIPSAALSYKQAIIDLKDPSKLSYRGAANELRETLRETLDYLAPDENVIAQEGFELEYDQKKPTMKQKARYLLKARGAPENAIKVPEESIGIIEERVASFTRATYVRSSISAHIASERNEVVQLKRYVNVVLSEFLAIKT